MKQLGMYILTQLFNLNIYLPIQKYENHQRPKQQKQLAPSLSLLKKSKSSEQEALRF